MTEAEADLRSGSLEVPDLVGATEAARILNVSPQHVRQMIDEGKPAAHRVGERAFALVRSEVEATAKTFVPRGMEWTTHPGLLGLLQEMDLSVDRVLPSPRIDVSIEQDGPHRARSVARYQFTVLGRYPGGKVIQVADGLQDLTEFDITRRSEWTTPE
ncbi:DNA-binding protein [Microbacterium enclense]|uniref:DNA-binding protein n=1 Tax=Microbacterium enclense TaxID=993073 RepID=A0A443J5Z5_9MICO|nr:helix-turn-helix domain-containing protein [Microbacterium enclense]RWR15813.1 DNA-binding protein [Microbacterium enclense]